jgi:hypothetical protein
VCLACAATAQAAVLDPGPPSIESLSVSQVSSHRATLAAQIDPDQLETTFQFWIEYPNCQNAPPGYGLCESISVRKVGEGTIAAGPNGQYVSATAIHLQGGYEYGYWVVASNAGGESKSPDQSFKALPEPTVESESVTGLAPKPIELHATIDPHGQAVYYQFQLVADPSEYKSELECPELGVELLQLPACTGEYAHGGALPIGRLEASCGPQSVSLNLAEAGVGLKVGATYHYRVLVVPAVQTEDTIQWEGPPTIGTDQSFTIGEDNVTPQSKPSAAGTDNDSSGQTGGDPPVTGGSNQLSAPAPLRTPASFPPAAHTRRHHPSPCSSAASARSRHLHRRSLHKVGPVRCARRTRRHRRR